MDKFTIFIDLSYVPKNFQQALSRRSEGIRISREEIVMADDDACVNLIRNGEATSFTKKQRL